MQYAVVYLILNSGKLEYITSIHSEVTAHNNATETVTRIKTTNYAQ